MRGMHIVEARSPKIPSTAVGSTDACLPGFLLDFGFRMRRGKTELSRQANRSDTTCRIPVDERCTECGGSTDWRRLRMAAIARFVADSSISVGVAFWS